MKFKVLFFALVLSNAAFASDTIRPISYTLPCALVGNLPNLVTYITPDGGFICGNSVYNTPEKAQKYYWNDSAKTLTAVAFWFGQKIQTGTPGQFQAKVYRVNPTTGAPAALLGISFPKGVSTIDTSDHLTVVTFPAPILLPDTFFVALDLTLLEPGDSIGLLSTEDSCYSGEQLAWEKESNGDWIPFNDGSAATSWELNIDMAIFPVGDFGLHTAIENISNSNITLYPNPVSETIFINLDNQDELKARIVDLQGKVVLEEKLSEQNNRIEVANLNPGTYFLELSNAQQSSVRKITIAR